MNKNELLKWLKAHLKGAEKHRNRAGRSHQHGEAQLAEGMAQAYAYTILHVMREEKK